MEYVDRVLKCSDCSSDFVFTAGEQLFFFDRQFKNDPKRCKLCKAKRAGFGKTAEGVPALAALPLSRTETRTECSACGIETTVPFKPTQGRPVFCRSCFQMKRVPAGVAVVAGLESPLAMAEAAMQHLTDSTYTLYAAGGSAAFDAIASLPASTLGSAEASTPSMEIFSAEAAQA